MNTTTSKPRPLLIRHLKRGDHVMGIGTVGRIENIFDDRFHVVWIDHARRRVVGRHHDGHVRVTDLPATMGEG